jgi:hypothetical protein
VRERDIGGREGGANLRFNIIMLSIPEFASSAIPAISDADRREESIESRK